MHRIGGLHPLTNQVPKEQGCQVAACQSVTFLEAVAAEAHTESHNQKCDWTVDAVLSAVVCPQTVLSHFVTKFLT